MNKKEYKNSQKSTKKNNVKGKFYIDKRDKNSRDLGVNKNSPSWYMLTPELGKLATAINFMHPNGLDVGFADGNNLINSSIAVTREPGVAANTIALIPGGISNDPLSAINEACRSMFTYIRSKLMKNITRYEKSDLFIMTYAVANIHAWIRFLVTILKTVKKYNVLNKYTPLALLKAMRIDTTNLVNLSIQLETYLSQLMFRVKNLIVPDIPLFSEVIYAFENIYVDEDIAKAQFIVNVPDYLWKYEVDEETSLGKLVLLPYVNKDNHTVQDLIDITENLLVNLINDEDYAFMSGDILAAYPNHYQLSLKVDTEPIEFTYSKEFLEKWHNSAQFGPDPTNTSVISDWTLTQRTSGTLEDYLVFDPIITMPSDASFELTRRGCGNRYLDFYDKDVTPEQIMTSTRWLFSLQIVSQDERKFKFYSLGSQLVTNIRIYYFDESGDDLKYKNYGGYIPVSKSSGNYTIPLDNILDELLIRKWNYSPLSIFIIAASDDAAISTGYFGVSGDLGNYTVITAEVLKQMNVLANYTLLGATPLIQGK